MWIGSRSFTHANESLGFNCLKFGLALAVDTGRRRQMESSRPIEDPFTKTIETYTAAIPSTGYLSVAIAAMAVSLVCQVTGRGKWSNFVAQWVPTWLIIGLYNKFIKVEGHDQYDRGRHNDNSRLTRADEVNVARAV
jgi:hypothetical protein